MKKFEFNYAQQRWDRYREFHTGGGYRHSPFIEFANGALIITSVADPYGRKLYDKYGVQLVTTTDSDLPPLYLSRDHEKPIPKAWVQQGGQQHLAVDHEQGVAVAVGYGGYHATMSNEWQVAVPDNLRSAFVYWSGPERLPTAVRTIQVSQPDPKTLAELNKKLAEVRPALHAIERMKNPPIQRWYNTGKVNVKSDWIDMPTGDIVAELSADDHTLKSAVVSGFSAKRIVTEVPYLYVKGDK